MNILTVNNLLDKKLQEMLEDDAICFHVDVSNSKDESRVVITQGTHDQKKQATIAVTLTNELMQLEHIIVWLAEVVVGYIKKNESICSYALSVGQYDLWLSNEETVSWLIKEPMAHIHAQLCFDALSGANHMLHINAKAVRYVNIAHAKVVCSWTKLQDGEFEVDLEYHHCLKALSITGVYCWIYKQLTRFLAVELGKSDQAIDMNCPLKLERFCQSIQSSGKDILIRLEKALLRKPLS